LIIIIRNDGSRAALPASRSAVQQHNAERVRFRAVPSRRARPAPHAPCADILGVSGRAMLQALIEGERDVHVLAELAKTRMRTRIPDLVAALTGNFREHHAFLCRIHLERIDQITTSILELSVRIEEAMRPFAAQLELLETIPGVGRSTAQVIIAETGADMTRFRTAGHLASWAGTTPGHRESAGKRKPAATRHGNRWLAATLGTAALAA
jgi:transposase